MINIDKGYTSRIEEFIFNDGIFDLCTYLGNKGYLLIVVTNQAGIARGYYKEEDFYILNDWMISEFKKRGINISKTYYCPYHPEKGTGQYKKDSFDRKPNPGMLLKAASEFDVDMAASIMIGDKDSDMEAAKRAGITTRILYDNGDCTSERTGRDSTITIKDLSQIYSLI